MSALWKGQRTRVYSRQVQKGPPEETQCPVIPWGALDAALASGSRKSGRDIVYVPKVREARASRLLSTGHFP